MNTEYKYLWHVSRPRLKKQHQIMLYLRNTGTVCQMTLTKYFPLSYPRITLYSISKTIAKYEASYARGG